MPKGWYAVYTRHQHEKSATDILAKKGFEVLLPLYRSLNRWKDRQREVLLPLFSGYVFVYADLEGKLDVLRTPGVCWFVANAGVPIPMPENDIDSIRLTVKHSLSFQPFPMLNCGDRVRVHSGPFAGIEGILNQVRNQYRVVISVESLCRFAAVEVDASALERVHAARRPSLGRPVENVTYA